MFDLGNILLKAFFDVSQHNHTYYLIINTFHPTCVFKFLFIEILKK